MNCLNGERYVREAIDSVFAQTYPDWEIVFWDNASTDRTAEIAQSYDSRLRYFRADRTVPLGPARNLAMQKAHGEWFAFVDYDDVCMPHRLERQMSALGTQDYAMCTAGIRDVDEQGRFIRDVLPRWRSGWILEQELTHFDLNLQTTMVNASYLKRYGLEIDERFQVSEDYNLFMRLSAKGPVCVVSEILSTCRILSASLTNQKLERHAIERLLTLDQLRSENPGIADRYPAAFAEATARGAYYRARNLMQMGDYAGARTALDTAKDVSVLYRVLSWVTFAPPLWQAIHDREIKAKLTRLFETSRQRP